jgi:hypothetical protein
MSLRDKRLPLRNSGIPDRTKSLEETSVEKWENFSIPSKTLSQERPPGQSRLIDTFTTLPLEWSANQIRIRGLSWSKIPFNEN